MAGKKGPKMPPKGPKMGPKMGPKVGSRGKPKPVMGGMGTMMGY